MKKILQYIRNHGAWAFAFMIAMASPILGPLAALSPLYPLAFASGTAVVLLTRNLRISLPMAFLVLACGKHHPGQSAPHFPTLGETMLQPARLHRPESSAVFPNIGGIPHPAL